MTVIMSVARCTSAAKRRSLSCSFCASARAARAEVRCTATYRKVTNEPIRTKKMPRLTQSLIAWGSPVAASAGRSGPATIVAANPTDTTPSSPKRAPATKTGR